MSLEFGAHTPEPVNTPEEKPANPFHILNRADIDRIPELSPLLAGVLDKGTVSMLAAQPAAGKTFLCLDWAARYACGLDWLDYTMDSTVDVDGDQVPGKVLYIAAEGGRTIKNRLNAWEEHWGHTVPPERFHMLGTPVKLGSSTSVQYLIDAMEANGPYGLVVIDTIARCSLGLEENSASDMGMVIEALYRIRNAMGVDGTVLAVHHHGKSGQARGSSALLGGVDQLMKLSRDDEHLELEDEKRKDSAELEPVALRLVPAGGSLVVDRGAGLVGGINPLVRVMHDDLAALLPLTKTDLIKASGMSDGVVLRHLAAGLKTGQIAEAKPGQQNPRYLLGEGLF